MKKTIRNVAVILAAGRGERSGFDRPKQMVKLAGKPMIEHTISVFQESCHIDEIVIVTNKECIEHIQDITANKRYTRVKSIILGGVERYHSSLAAIAATEHLTKDYKVNLIFHDAVRPLLSDRVIGDVVEALVHYSAVDVVVNTTDTIVSANTVTNTIDSIPIRAHLRNGQTPQGFWFDTIKEAYRLAMIDPAFKTTDDCGVVLRYLPNEKVYLVNGEHSNIKLTYAEDLQIMDKLLQLKTTNSRDLLLDEKQLSHLKDKVIVVFGGTSGIGADIVRLSREYQAVAVAVSRTTGVDITNIDDVRKCLEGVFCGCGRIDYVVNCAAILHKQPLANMEYIDILRSVNVNYIGAINIAVVSHDYLQQTGGHLLNFTSSSYTYGRAYYSLYSSCKAAVVNLTQALAEEWYSDNIRVNCINPERTNTPMRTRAFGIEPIDSLLKSETVARQSLGVLLSKTTAQVFDIRK